MAGGKKKSKKKSAPRKSAAESFFRGVISLIILAALVGAAIFVAQKYIPGGGGKGLKTTPEKARHEEEPIKKKTDKMAAADKTPRPEFEDQKPEKREVEAEKPQHPGKSKTGDAKPVAEKPNLPEASQIPDEKKPLLAIIIDDLGYTAEMDGKFVRFPAPLTLAVMPRSPGAKKTAETGYDAGKVILAHVPMEPLGYPEEDPGPGALLTSMDADTLVETLRADIAKVPHAKGVNNHMGSRLTQEANALLPLFTALKKDGLFFVDSVTSPQSRAGAVAGMLSLPFARRDVFLDHTRSKADVTQSLLKAVSLAAKNGKAVAIGHPHPVTYGVLQEMLSEIRRQVKIVPVTEIVK